MCTRCCCCCVSTLLVVLSTSLNVNNHPSALDGSSADVSGDIVGDNAEM